MILLLLHFLREWGVRVPAVFEYSSTRMALAAITALLLSIFCGPLFIRRLYALKIGQPIRKDECPLLGELHKKKQDTPTMGGLLILVSMVIALLLWMDWAHSFTWILLLTTLFLGGLGAYDDYLKLRYKNSKGLKSRRKFALQNLFAAAFAIFLIFWSPSGHHTVTDVYFPFFKGPKIGRAHV